jgi:WD40 repeat protein
VIYTRRADDGLGRLDLANKRELDWIPVKVTAWPTFDKRGEKLWALAIGDNRLVVHSGPDLAGIGAWQNQPTEKIDPDRSSLSAGQQWVLAGYGDDQTRLFSASQVCLAKQWTSPGGRIRSVALSPMEDLAVSGTEAGTVQIVRVPTAEQVSVLKAHRGPVTSVAFNPNGDRLATASHDRTVRLWQRDGESFRELVTLPADGPVLQVVFHPDGKRLAMVVEGEHAVRIWHLDRLEQELKKLALGW